MTPGSRAGEVTEKLHLWRAGKSGALEELLPLVYQELRVLARRRLRGRRSRATLDTTGLVHEVYLKLVDQTRPDWKDRCHFFAVAATAMRQILVDRARKRATKKRAWGIPRELDERSLRVEARAEEILALDEALGDLVQLNERLGRVVELRFFGGLTEDESAEVLGVTPRTVRRDWQIARAFLYKTLCARAEP